jgi:drug/metabolite transporter (DMT)-like permease
MDLPDFAEPVAPGMRTGCLGRIVQIALFLALIALALGGQLYAWVGGALNSQLDGATTAAAATAIQAALTAILLLPFALFWRARREAAIYRTWLAAALYPCCWPRRACCRRPATP